MSASSSTSCMVGPMKESWKGFSWALEGEARRERPRRMVAHRVPTLRIMSISNGKTGSRKLSHFSPSSYAENGEKGSRILPPIP